MFFSADFKILYEAIFQDLTIYETKHICSLALVSYINNKIGGSIPVNIPFKNDVYCWLYTLNNYLMEDNNPLINFIATQKQKEIIQHIVSTKNIC